MKFQLLFTISRISQIFFFFWAPELPILPLTLSSISGPRAAGLGPAGRAPPTARRQLQRVPPPSKGAAAAGSPGRHSDCRRRSFIDNFDGGRPAGGDGRAAGRRGAARAGAPGALWRPRPLSHDPRARRQPPRLLMGRRPVGRRLHRHHRGLRAPHHQRRLQRLCATQRRVRVPSERDRRLGLRHRRRRPSLRRG